MFIGPVGFFLLHLFLFAFAFVEVVCYKDEIHRCFRRVIESLLAAYKTREQALGGSMPVHPVFVVVFLFLTGH